MKSLKSARKTGVLQLVGWRRRGGRTSLLTLSAGNHSCRHYRYCCSFLSSELITITWHCVTSPTGTWTWSACSLLWIWRCCGSRLESL